MYSVVEWVFAVLFDLDKSIFFFVNKTLGYPFLDLLMRFFSSVWVWVGIFGAVLFYAIIKKKWLLILFLFYVVFSIGIIDAFVSQIIKPWVSRLRPCREFLDMVRIVNNCAGVYGFPSNHATNSFTVSTMLGIFLKDTSVQKFLIIIASLICISRVYIGVHYPSDVIFGALIGAIWGYVMYKIFIFVYNEIQNKWL